MRHLQSRAMARILSILHRLYDGGRSATPMSHYVWELCIYIHSFTGSCRWKDSFMWPCQFLVSSKWPRCIEANIQQIKQLWHMFERHSSALQIAFLKPLFWWRGLLSSSETESLFFLCKFSESCPWQMPKKLPLANGGTWGFYFPVATFPLFNLLA